MESLFNIVGIVLATVAGLFAVYLITRLISYAILNSMDDVKRKRQEDKHGKPKG